MNTTHGSEPRAGGVSEWGAILLTLLLPVKFASITSVPEMPASYWFDFFSIVLTTWPIHVFSLFAAILLLFAAIVCRKPSAAPVRSRPALWFAVLWGVLALSSLCGWANASCRDYALQMISYTFGMTAYAWSLYLLLERRPGFSGALFAALLAGCALSLCSGLYQYFFGFEALKQHVYEQNLQSGQAPISGQFLGRILEARVQADFSVCNTYGGYLAFLLPLSLFSAWKFGSTQVSPERTSRWVLSLPVLAVFAFLIAMTGSRGALFSLLGATALVAASLPMNAKYRTGLILLLLGGAAGFCWIVISGRGFNSMYFRFDYDWAAFRMMLRHPFLGTGWGDFFHDYQQIKLLLNDEAPHTPHNFPLLFGSQCGVPAFFAAGGLLLIPCAAAVHACRTVVEPWRRGFAFAAAFALLAAACDSLMEISYETPAFIGTFTAIAFVLFYRLNPETAAFPLPQRPLRTINPGGRSVLAVILAVAALTGAVFMIRAEIAFAALHETVDRRFSKAQLDPSQKEPPPTPDQVARLLNNAASANPWNPFVWAAAADFMIGAGDLPAAEHYLDEAIVRSPRRAAFHHRRALVRYLRTGDPSAAADDLARMRECFPKNPQYQVPDAELLTPRRTQP